MFQWRTGIHSQWHLRIKNVILILFALIWIARTDASGIVLILDYHSFLGIGTSSLDFSPTELAA